MHPIKIAEQQSTKKMNVQREEEKPPPSAQAPEPHTAGAATGTGGDLPSMQGHGGISPSCPPASDGAVG